MKKIVILLAVFILALILVSCAPRETGTISFSTPAWGQVFRDEYSGAYQYAPLIVSSTYQNDKIVRFSTGEQSEAVVCLVKANAVDQSCPDMPLYAPGEYTITAEVNRLDGSIATSMVEFKWDPFTVLDKTMFAWSLTSSPVGGYLVVYGLLLMVSSLITGLITKDWIKVAIANVVLTAVLIVILFFLPSAGPAVAANCWLVPFLVLLGMMTFGLIRLRRPLLRAIRPDGTEIRYESRPSGRSDEPLVVNLREIHQGLDVKGTIFEKRGGNL
ncbi:hypothetical protein A3K29_05495 [Candidatus Collierbacteria bacterium RIFOXYB2_FULL_46_14]|uniref:Uncharacterized protein n=1 Tax=Candidatus Collierbacteria bacterium GW2011_GWA2_46_26 TaxID=1618381 RepID=A0A0G1PL10_9BACT|nr:MAG: hypothetical protein UX47_C0004G0017 [Candidatus Collierbacteria bacterium GW2011_GWA2_46_26]OGD73545.1 MAG: hypothetical protein A3K29_05495 [Candidatus Collierbacteria bacterium RIFOXYB2_FULL_46_14]OGD76587.1 MAG: hypothetical protein A3K43_05495 [Candidatus Collierbacteria bacterium RIFOXYA2_FULL_46_20]OGD77923.1 MAG: hypothetical protein A3K39_05495 [Candidatus Collierbacteria bacterium RIFOXYC2_FULL_43_15]OGD81214.1 MAG: hypothetical protein A2320_05995 [Pseudomonadales bacterium G